MLTTRAHHRLVRLARALAQGELERFVGAGTAQTLRTCFAGLYGLEEDGGAAVEDIVRKAIASPDGFVLKPQREVGAHASQMNVGGDGGRVLSHTPVAAWHCRWWE